MTNACSRPWLIILISAGSGKTVLWYVLTMCIFFINVHTDWLFVYSSSVIQTLENSGSPYAFFFFDRRDGQEHLQSFDSVICSITYQLCSWLDAFPEVIAEIHSRCGSGSTPPSHLSLQKMLICAIQHLPEAFIVIDALDECREIVEVGSWLQNLASSSLSSLHVLFTSRDVPIVSDEVKRIPHEILRVNECTSEDIDIFITESITKSRLSRWPNELQETIRQSLYEGADGM